MEKKKKKFSERMRNKYRLVVMNDETFEEKVRLKLTPRNLFIILGTILLTLITLIIYLIAFTPLREYIPGYADVGMQKKVYQLSLVADSLQKELEFRDQFLENMKNVILGTTESADKKDKPDPPKKSDQNRSIEPSKEDLELRAMIEAEDRYELMQKEKGVSSNSGVRSFFLFTPVKGTITNTFNTNEKHFGVDVTAAPNEAVKAALDGTVIISNWTSETGYVIGIQHSNNFLTLYKHNSALLKKVGAYVKAGEAVAIIGNSGELSTGPHLHFEIWFNGSPVNPQNYVSF